MHDIEITWGQDKGKKGVEMMNMVWNICLSGYSVSSGQYISTYKILSNSFDID